MSHRLRELLEVGFRNLQASSATGITEGHWQPPCSVLLQGRIPKYQWEAIMPSIGISAYILDPLSSSPCSRPCNASVEFSSVAQSCPTLCDPTDCSTPGLPVHHQLPEFTQTHVHWVGDAIQLSHPLSSPSPPALNLSQHQGLFKWVSSSPQVANVLESQLQHQSFQWTPRTDFF